MEDLQSLKDISDLEEQVTALTADIAEGLESEFREILDEIEYERQRGFEEPVLLKTGQTQ